MVSSENAGMSNHKAGENCPPKSAEVSWATVIVPGLVGPKPRRVAWAMDNRLIFLYRL